MTEKVFHGWLSAPTRIRESKQTENNPTHDATRLMFFKTGEETDDGRVVRVTNPSSTSKKIYLLPQTFLAEFVVYARLGGQTAPGSMRCRQTSASALALVRLHRFYNRREQ